MTRSENLGAWGEDRAAKYLADKGLEILCKNLETPVGECDLLAADGEELVFVEVKTRQTGKFGPPEEAVTEEKRDQLRRIATYQLRDSSYDRCRFDVVGIEFDPSTSEIRHHQAAFTALE